MTRSIGPKALLLICGLAAATTIAVAGDSPLSLADLEAYRVALAAEPDASAPLVRFRDLWDRPGEFTGRTVAVEGRVARMFRQPRFADFPPLAEAWVISRAGDPFCLVFPQREGRPTPDVGASVRFSGTFLRRIEYQGGDEVRLAPLIVGPMAPRVPPGPLDSWGEGWSSSDYLLAVGASILVAAVLVGRHLDRPVRVARTIEPPPLFVDGKPGAGGDFDDIG